MQLTDVQELRWLFSKSEVAWLADRLQLLLLHEDVEGVGPYGSNSK